MLIIHKPLHKKLFFLVITSIGSIGALLGLSLLAYTPELSHAETVSSKKTLADIEYMQEVTADICTNTPEADTEGNYQYQLKDSRDQKTYWVAKLKDGNCWMTQNLDLDLKTTISLTSDTSDVPNWRPSYDTQIEVDNQWGNDNSSAKSYDPGIKICKEYKAACVAPPSNDYDYHHLSGNLYSYPAAVAGSAPKASGTANYSICPRGWQLPPVSGEKSFANLFNAYGGLNDIKAGEYDIRDAPFYFIYNGYNSYTWFNSGTSGYYWTASTRSASTGYNLYISTNIKPSNYENYDRYPGFAVRCVARTSDGNKNVKITVTPQLSLDVANEVMIEKNETNPSTANLDVKVSSNQKYSVGISTDNPNLTSTTNNVTIPAKSGLLNTAENAWGIKKSEDTNYTALTTSPQTFYTASGAEVKTIPFTIGISTSPDIPNGEYSTNITITATQN